MISNSQNNIMNRDEVIIRIKKKASDVARQLVNWNVPKECAIVERVASRTIYIPQRFMGMKIGSKAVDEQYKETILSGWLLFESVILMGEDSNDQEWFKWTRYYYLGEDGNLYSRYEEILEKHRLGSISVNLRDAVKVETIKDFIQSYESQQTKDSWRDSRIIGGNFDSALDILYYKYNKQMN